MFLIKNPALKRVIYIKLNKKNFLIITNEILLNIFNFFKQLILRSILFRYFFKKIYTKVTYIIQFFKGKLRKQWFRYIKIIKLLTVFIENRLRCTIFFNIFIFIFASFY